MPTPCAQWDLLAQVGWSPEPRHCSHCLGPLFVSGASGAGLAEMGASCLESRPHRLAAASH